jgi:2-keto-4-pentenoate hydratase/2-oxohepta-3-ene-1,7-dioic acid hydratase in catechol pathway
LKYVTFEAHGGLRHVGMLRDDRVIDLSIVLAQTPGRVHISQIDMFYVIGLERDGLAVIEEAMATSDADLAAREALWSVEQVRLLAPITRPRKNVLCLGRNYAEHRAESMRAFNEAPEPPPEYPAIFTKAITTVIGPYDDIPYDPNVSRLIDWEGELAFVIGRAGKNIKRDASQEYIFGYLALNDISARDIQVRHGGQYFKGKSLDGSCPIGPWIITPEEVGDPGDLRIITTVNGVEKQNGNTRDMIFDVPSIVEMLSLGMTLEPGDIVATGTPSGIGHARTPPEYLRPGDVVQVEIDRIGGLRNKVVGV